jgi:hypothetical protein
VSPDRAFDYAYNSWQSATATDGSKGTAVAAKEAAIVQDKMDFANATTADAAFNALSSQRAHERELSELRREKTATAKDVAAARARYDAACAAIK